MPAAPSSWSARSDLRFRPLTALKRSRHTPKFSKKSANQVLTGFRERTEPLRETLSQTHCGARKRSWFDFPSAPPHKSDCRLRVLLLQGNLNTKKCCAMLSSSPLFRGRKTPCLLPSLPFVDSATSSCCGTSRISSDGTGTLKRISSRTSPKSTPASSFVKRGTLPSYATWWRSFGSCPRAQATRAKHPGRGTDLVSRPRCSPPGILCCVGEPRT